MEKAYEWSSADKRLRIAILLIILLFAGFIMIQYFENFQGILVPTAEHPELIPRFTVVAVNCSSDQSSVLISVQNLNPKVTLTFTRVYFTDNTSRSYKTGPDIIVTNPLLQSDINVTLPLSNEIVKISCNITKEAITAGNKYFLIFIGNGRYAEGLWSFPVIPQNS